MLRPPLAGLDPREVRWTRKEATIPAPAGAEILAPEAGTVTRVWFDRDVGHAVRIVHPDGSWSAFTHLAGPSPVKRGAGVAAGDVIGKVGPDGARGHLVQWHYVGKAGRYLDPRRLLHTPQGRFGVVVFTLAALLLATLALPDSPAPPANLREY